MDSKDRIAIMATILLAARIQRGSTVDKTNIKEAIKTAQDIGREIPED